MFRRISPHAESRSARHGLRQTRQVGPDIPLEFTDDQISPVATCPFGWWFFELGPTLPTPRAKERSLLSHAERRLNEIGIKHIVIVNKDEEVARRFTDRS